MECSLLMSKQKLELIDILKEAASIPCKNIKFAIFSLLTSFPLLCFLVFYDTVLHKTLTNTSTFVSQYSHSWEADYYIIDLDTLAQPVIGINTKFWDSCPQLVQFCLLYLVPYQILELFSLVMTVDAASDIYSVDDDNNKNNNKKLSLQEMIVKSFDKTRLIGPFITSIYVMFFSTATLVGLLWIVINYYIISGSFTRYMYGFGFFDNGSPVVILIVLHGMAFCALLRKYLEWSAGWNMSIVVSVVEEAYGAEALDDSAYFIRGSEQRGLHLMSIFFIWTLVLRLPCICLGCSDKAGGVGVTCAVITLAWLGTIMKWVACMVYYYDCKRRVLEKKIDVEVGSNAKAVDS